MELVIIASFSVGLIFGGIATAAASINEIQTLRKMLSAYNSEDEVDVIENT
jgi:hypothetical protein